MKLATFFLIGCASVALAQLPPHPVPQVTRNGDTCNLDWTGQNSITYFVQYSLDLQSWSYMPVIESGDGSAIGYGFECDTDKMFLRLHYTDMPTSNPNSDDFDGDSISNWDEVRVGGTGTSPLVADTNADGIRDDGLVYAAQNDPDGVGLPASLQSDLLGRWDFEQLNFTPPTFSYADKTGNGWTASAYGVVNHPEGMVSKAVDIQNGYCSVDADILQGKSNYSISFWLNLDKDKLKDANNGTMMGVYGLYDYTYYIQGGLGYTDIDSNGLRVKKVGNTEEWNLGNYIYTNHANGVHGQTFSQETNTMRWTRPLGTSDDGKWHHMAIVRSNGQYSVYFDNQLVSSGSFIESNIQFTAVSGLVFGRYFTQVGSPAASTTQMQGKFDRMRIYGKSLTAADVQSLYRQDIDTDGLWDITENGSLLWRDLNSNEIRESNESTYYINPYYFDNANSDHDGDGRTSLDEQNDTQDPTDLSNPDTDGDLMPDGWELDNGLDPNDPNDANIDSDLDGATNLVEYSFNSDPNDKDTDDDGIEDGPEINGSDGNPDTPGGSNPNDASDDGQPLLPEEKLAILIGVGDQSGSESEDYIMNIYRLNSETGQEELFHVLRSGGHGQYKEITLDIFRRGDSYTFQLDWQSSNLGSSGDPNSPEGPDFDYTFKVEPVDDDILLVDPYDPLSQNEASWLVGPLLGNQNDVEFIQNEVEQARVAVLAPRVTDLNNTTDDQDDEVVATNGFAWIDAHSGPAPAAGQPDQNIAPRMPNLSATVHGGANLANRQVRWRLRVHYDRGNGTRGNGPLNGRNQAEDTIYVPARNAQAQVQWTGLTAANQAWQIFHHADWTNEIQQRGFFGGQVELYMWVDGQAQPNRAALRFRIGGANPDDARCRAYIDQQAPLVAANLVNGQTIAVGTGLWYAYGIAKSETANLNGANTRYNAFMALPVHRRDQGLPIFGADGGVGPGGYGLFQVTGTSADNNANIVRRQIWNWQDNVTAGLDLVGYKKYGPDQNAHAVRWMLRQANANNANGVALPNHTVRTTTFAANTVRTMTDAVAIKVYNGASRPPNTFVDNGAAPGFRLDPQGSGHYCYWRNASNEWALNRFNNPPSPIAPFNYVDRICSEL